jgi:hypothetical protein
MQAAVGTCAAFGSGAMPAACAGGLRPDDDPAGTGSAAGSLRLTPDDPGRFGELASPAAAWQARLMRGVLIHFSL